MSMRVCVSASDSVVGHLIRTLEKRLFLTLKFSGIFCWGYSVVGMGSVCSVYDVLSE